MSAGLWIHVAFTQQQCCRRQSRLQTRFTDGTQKQHLTRIFTQTGIYLQTFTWSGCWVDFYSKLILPRVSDAVSFCLFPLSVGFPLLIQAISLAKSGTNELFAFHSVHIKRWYLLRADKVCTFNILNIWFDSVFDIWAKLTPVLFL